MCVIINMNDPNALVSTAMLSAVWEKRKRSKEYEEVRNIVAPNELQEERSQFPQ